jgi:hypothetical protein
LQPVAVAVFGNLKKVQPVAVAVFPNLDQKPDLTGL